MLQVPKEQILRHIEIKLMDRRRHSIGHSSSAGVRNTRNSNQDTLELISGFMRLTSFMSHIRKQRSRKHVGEEMFCKSSFSFFSSVPWKTWSTPIYVFMESTTKREPE